MLFGMGKKTPLLDEDSIQWMFETFAWGLRYTEPGVFQNSILVTPSNAHFPGRANSVEEMASLVFHRVVEYAGMAHWPWRLMEASEAEQLVTSSVPALPEVKRSFSTSRDLAGTVTEGIPVAYQAHQINDPQVLIGSFAHTLAHYLASAMEETPPGGRENWPHTTELLAVFMGFGIIMSNSAFTNRVRSCGSCAGPIVERMNFLSQHDLCYALAMFARLKNLDAKQVLPYLKKSLRGFYKKSAKDVEARDRLVNNLQRLIR